MEISPSMGSIFFLDRLPTVTVERVRSALECTGLDAQFARDLAKRFCFVRAKNRMRADGLIDEVEETEARWTWQLSRRYREQERLGYEFEAAFWFDKQTQTVGGDNAALFGKVQALFARYGALYLPSDVSKVVRRIFERQKGLLSLRHAGAVYFVPRENRGLLQRVARFVSELGGECLIVPVGLENELVREKALEVLVQSVREDLVRLFEEMQKARAEDGLTKRQARHRWKALTEHLDRVKVFARSLSADAAGLLAKVRTSELDLALVAKADLDVMATLAHAGRLGGALGQIVRTAFDGDLLAVSSPRVQAVLPALDQALVELPALVTSQAVPTPIVEENVQAVTQKSA
ncbi:MAG: hypothetical protein HY291_21880 [Planctomycetes bacterium]|nr:hypothetical protein [Planctomycetota bacterium]